MTREEAIERLKTDIYKYADFKENPNENEFWMAFDMAIKALEQEPCEDCISRQAVIDAIYDMEILKYRIDLENVIDALPSVNPQPCEDANANQHNSNALNDVGQHTNALDAISRQAAIDVIENWLECSDYNEAERHIMRATESILYDLPPVKPQEPSITWVTGADGAKIAFWDVPVWKVTKICEILGEPQERSEE